MHRTRLASAKPKSSRQLRLDRFLLPVLVPELPSRLPEPSASETVTIPEPGSTVQTSVSPGPTPRIAATGEGTVVRIDSERSRTRTAFDSNPFFIAGTLDEAGPPKKFLGQQVGQRVGTNVKYSRAVGQLVGQHVSDANGGMSAREARGLAMLHGGLRVLESTTPGEYVVASQSGKGFYRLTGVGIPGAQETCGCPDFVARLAPCKHVFAVRHWIGASRVSVGPLYPPVPSRHRQINWTPYNEAQNDEYRLVPILLRELCKGISEPIRDPHAAGRPAIPLRDQAFCAVQRSYFGFPLRTLHGFHVESAMKGMLEAAPYWAVASRFLCRDDVTEELHSMLARSALPLIGVEDTCAVDSTGLRTTRFNHYRKEKYEPGRENIWRKMHALVGVRTHAIVALEVTDSPANDSPQFPILLRKAKENGFRFKRVLADRAYQGRANFNAAAKLDIEPFIPYKKNQTGQTKGSPMYHKMYLYFRYHREKFDEQYRQRVQIESAFGGLKQKFGETIASRKFTSQTNEVLCKAIAHNITILIRRMYETGLLPDFLQPAGGQKGPAVRPDGLARQVPSTTGRLTASGVV